MNFVRQRVRTGERIFARDRNDLLRTLRRWTVQKVIGFATIGQTEDGQTIRLKQPDLEHPLRCIPVSATEIRIVEGKVAGYTVGDTTITASAGQRINAGISLAAEGCEVTGVSVAVGASGDITVPVADIVASGSGLRVIQYAIHDLDVVCCVKGSGEDLERHAAAVGIEQEPWPDLRNWYTRRFAQRLEEIDNVIDQCCCDEEPDSVPESSPSGGGGTPSSPDPGDDSGGSGGGGMGSPGDGGM